MKKLFCVGYILLAASASFAENRFGRPVVKVNDQKAYVFVKTDDVEYPTLSNERFSVSCLVYRGTYRYYVEVAVENKTSLSIDLLPESITFDKPGYLTYATSTVDVARAIAIESSQQFVPTPPPYIPPTYKTNFTGTTTSYGNQTDISGTATTRADYSGQAGANFGNAIGNGIAAYRFHKFQQTERAFSTFLATHAQTENDLAILPGQSRLVVATFEQAKHKKKPFNVSIKLGPDTFNFVYKE